MKACGSCCHCAAEKISKQTLTVFLKKIKNWKQNQSGDSIWREYVMKDFAAAVDLINRVARIAEKQNHHPDIYLSGYRNLKFTLSTHSIGGLSENDLILALGIERLPKKLQKSTR